MSVLYILLPLALVIAGAAVALFVWAARRGQFDDLESPPLRAILDDDPVPPRADRDEDARIDS